MPGGREGDPKNQGVTAENRAWLERDLSRLSEFEPYEWSEDELEAGEPVRYVPGVGAFAGGSDDAGEDRP